MEKYLEYRRRIGCSRRRRSNSVAVRKCPLPANTAACRMPRDRMRGIIFDGSTPADRPYASPFMTAMARLS